MHVHVVIRLDNAMPEYRADVVHPPPPRFAVELLEDALRAAAGAVDRASARRVGGGYVTWGAQLDVQHLDPGTRGGGAGYLAKYATKATEQAGGVLHRVTEYEVDELP